jgi:hypothetical protein
MVRGFVASKTFCQDLLTKEFIVLLAKPLSIRVYGLLPCKAAIGAGLRAKDFKALLTKEFTYGK